MTRPELHALVDIVMDARERGFSFCIENEDDYTLVNHLASYDYPTFSDFTQAVKEYIKTLEK